MLKDATSTETSIPSFLIGTTRASNGKFSHEIGVSFGAIHGSAQVPWELPMCSNLLITLLIWLTLDPSDSLSGPIEDY